MQEYTALMAEVQDKYLAQNDRTDVVLEKSEDQTCTKLKQRCSRHIQLGIRWCFSEDYSITVYVTSCQIAEAVMFSCVALGGCS
eukprot:5401737-Amphidinium_carterae.1